MCFTSSDRQRVCLVFSDSGKHTANSDLNSNIHQVQKEMAAPRTPSKIVGLPINSGPGNLKQIPFKSMTRSLRCWFIYHKYLEIRPSLEHDTWHRHQIHSQLSIRQIPVLMKVNFVLFQDPKALKPGNVA